MEMIKTKLQIRKDDFEDLELAELDWIDFYFDSSEVAGFNESDEKNCTTVMFKGGERFVLAMPIDWFINEYPYKKEIVIERVKFGF